MNEPAPPRLTRRDVLAGSLAAGAAIALERSHAATAPAAPLTRAIPASAERLPVVGLGTDKFRTRDRDAIRAEIGRLHERGGTVIDTAAAYGDSEALIGETLAALGIREHMFIATKLTASGAGFFGDGVGGQASFERSLARLKTTRVELLQVHNLDGVDSLMPMLREWKQAGRIRYIGITTSQVGQHAEMLAYMRKYPLDFIQVDYSLANRDAAASILPLAQERRIAVLANIPFGFGSVFRSTAKRQLPAWAAQIDAASWGQFLLKYVISHPAVTCVIPGSTQVAHLEDNQAAARGKLPDEAMRRKMEQFWDAG